MALPPARPLTQPKSTEVVDARPATPYVRPAYPVPSENLPRRERRAQAYRIQDEIFELRLKAMGRRLELDDKLKLWKECAVMSLDLLDRVEAEIDKGVSDRKSEALLKMHADFIKLTNGALGIHDDATF